MATALHSHSINAQELCGAAGLAIIAALCVVAMCLRMLPD